MLGLVPIRNHLALGNTIMDIIPDLTESAMFLT